MSGRSPSATSMVPSVDAPSTRMTSWTSSRQTRQNVGQALGLVERGDNYADSDRQTHSAWFPLPNTKRTQPSRVPSRFRTGKVVRRYWVVIQVRSGVLPLHHLHRARISLDQASSAVDRRGVHRPSRSYSTTASCRTVADQGRCPMQCLEQCRRAAGLYEHDAAIALCRLGVAPDIGHDYRHAIAHGRVKRAADRRAQVGQDRQRRRRAM